MIKLLGINIDKKKIIKYGLTKIFGIGLKKAILICKNLQIDSEKKFCELNENEINNIKKHLNSLVLENELKKKIHFDIKKKIQINSYQGIRHTKKLPVRGQRTKTNAKTKKKKK